MPDSNLITRPAGYAIDPADIKQELGLRKGNTAHDDAINRHIAAATALIEEYTRRNLVSRTWDTYYNRFPSNGGEIVLPKAPVISVTSIQYIDVTASPELVTVDSSSYSLAPSEGAGHVYLNYGEAWPTASNVRNAVVVRYVAGYATGGSPEQLAQFMPESLRQALAMLSVALFENPTAQTDAQLHDNQALKLMLQQQVIPHL